MIDLATCHDNLRRRDTQANYKEFDADICASAVRPPGRWRYNVLGAHPSCCATSIADMLPEASIAFAALILDASSAAGRPPRRPRAAAATRPARVRSTMISRSMELSAPRMLNMNRPLGVVVSMLSVIDLSATPRRFRSSAMSI